MSKILPKINVNYFFFEQFVFYSVCSGYCTADTARGAYNVRPVYMYAAKGFTPDMRTQPPSPPPPPWEIFSDT